ncbi:YihY/virulence factor BrkB family protein [Methanococcoides sp. FTZ1]|uniref:YihY/virulence factor BrkB family protein n=1 Tax=Methanococcoides sp. FTZ1 TaxID=3439061 RepID=UPI003F869CCA
MGKFRDVALQTVKEWNSDDGISFSAALSFYLIISLPSLLLFSLSLGGMFLKVEWLQAAILDYISPFANDEIIFSLNLLFQQLPQTSSLTFGLVSSFLLFLWSAGNIFLHFQRMVNDMWGVTDYKKGRVERIFRKRISSLVAVFTFSVLLILSILMEIFLVVVSKIITTILPFSLNLIQYASSVANFCVLTVLFVYLYTTLPEKKVGIKYIMTGSFLTVLFITIGKHLFSLYISYSTLTTVYTKIGAFLAVFLWLYYSSIIVTLMAEFIKVYSDIEQ